MKRQASLSELWQGAVFKPRKTAERQPFSSLKARLPAESWADFQAEVAAKHETEKAAAAEREKRRAEREARKGGELTDPSCKGTTMTTGGREASTSAKRRFAPSSAPPG